MRVPDPELTQRADGTWRATYLDLGVHGDGATEKAAVDDLKRELKDRSQDPEFQPRFRAWLDQFRGTS